jgi:hypothetical protein
VSRLLRILRFRRVATTLVLLAAFGLYQGWLTWSVAAKLPAELPPRADVEIVLTFAPESFHVTRLQDLGRVIRVEDRSVFVREMRAADVRAFARNYWVADVRPWPGD